MKKTFIIIMLCATALGVHAQSSVNQGAGVLRELTGDVELKPAGKSDFIHAQVGDEIAQNTIVSTGFKSTALIEVGSSVIAVRPLTRLSLAEIQSGSGAENLNMNLQSGRIKVDVKPPAGARASVTVHSPSATASVRGTSFEFDTKRLKVIEGTVSFAGKSGAAMSVSAGGESLVRNEGSAADPAEIAAAVFQSIPMAGANSTGGTLPPPQTTGTFSARAEY